MGFCEKTIQTLEFDKIREMLADVAPTEGAKLLARRLMPVTDISSVLRRLHRTEDAYKLMMQKGLPLFGNVKDMGDSVERACKGAMLSPRELLDIEELLRVTRSVADYGKENRTFTTGLDESFHQLLPNRFLEEAIKKAIFSEDMIADEASTALAEVRRKMRETQNKIKETLAHFISGAYAELLQDNIVTQRAGRYVIPVKAECKNQIKGLIHDTSASGSTVFIEPMAVVEANNNLRLLANSEQREIEKVLYTLSSEVGSASESLRLDYEILTSLAFVFAMADLGLRMGGRAVTVSGDRSLCLRRARHPLIDEKKVVPIDVALGKDYDTLIITGPNTGGKTVALKTLGLFACMMQSGLLLPVEEGSSLCVFDDVLVDIGDDQSIAQNLSTFSSHMVNIVEILKNVNDRSLCLFDELGAGTDPIEGAALATAVIEEVRSVGALCVSTTHYTELKVFALETAGVENASCEFDVKTLKPTYRLLIGTPGASNAFAISERLGLEEGVINRAKAHVSGDARRFERVIAELEADRSLAEQDKVEASKAKAEAEALLARAKKEAEGATAKAKAEAEKQLKKANELLDGARVSANYIFSQIDKAKKEADAGRFGDADKMKADVRRAIHEGEDLVDPVVEMKNEKYVLPRALKKGDRVLLVHIGKEGNLNDLPDAKGNVSVTVGIMTIKTKVDNLRLVEETGTVTDSRGTFSSKQFTPKIADGFKPEIDLRGMTGEEGWHAVDKYLDDAVLSGLTTVSLIHGKGTGALKKYLWECLRKDKRIKAYRIGQFGEGDGGVTVVTLK